LLTLDQAADVAECSDEKIRKACELAAMTNRPMGVKWATRWLVGKARLLDDIENGKLGSCRGIDARPRADERARKYKSWARPQGPFKRARPGSNAAQYGVPSLR
jgi:predicted dehydrogenase